MLFSISRIPDAQGVVFRAGNSAGAVGGDRHGIDPVGMAPERGEGLAGFEVPDAQGLVNRAGNGAAAVGGDRHGPDAAGMALERGEGLAGCAGSTW